MPWGRMDDKFHRNTKVRILRRHKHGRAALGVWTFWWSWCLDDPALTGFVPADELPAEDAKLAPTLVEVGLWDEVDGGYQFHDFNEYNPTKEQVETKKERDRQRAAGKRAAGSGASRTRLHGDSPANSERVAVEPKASPPRVVGGVASTRDPIPSHPIPSEEERDARPAANSDQDTDPPDKPVPMSREGQLWAAWCRAAANGMPMGSPSAHWVALGTAWEACEARDPTDPVAVFEAAAAAYVESKRASGNRFPIRFLLTDIGDWLDAPAPKSEPVPLNRRILE